MTKPKCLTKLPMPPGVIVSELEDINTPSPPRSNSPITKQPKISSKLNQTVTVAKKAGLLTLPMPPMVPGSEELSGDEEYTSSPGTVGRSGSKQSSASAGSSNHFRKDVKRKRPTIINRRNSRSLTIKDWGERCVDVFEVIAQIGEGTYGQVCI